MEPNIVEIYVDRTTKGILEYCPASGMVGDGEDLPEDAIFITQININDVIEEAEEETKMIMICPHVEHCCADECIHVEEHEADETCEKDCFVYDYKGGCFVAEFTPLDDVGDEEEIG
jgi:hypothetical protein